MKRILIALPLFALAFAIATGVASGSSAPPAPAPCKPGVVDPSAVCTACRGDLDVNTRNGEFIVSGVDVILSYYGAHLPATDVKPCTEGSSVVEASYSRSGFSDAKSYVVEMYGDRWVCGGRQGGRYIRWTCMDKPPAYEHEQVVYSEVSWLEANS